MADNLVTIARYWYSHEAELARIHLEEAGIPSFIADELANSMGLGYMASNATGGIKVQIAESNVEKAMAVMADWPAPRTRSEVASSDLEPLRCLACGKRMLEDQIECQECGWSYLADSAETETDNSRRADQTNDLDEETDSQETGIRRGRPHSKPRQFDRERPAGGPTVCPSCGQALAEDQLECSDCGWSDSESNAPDAAPSTSIQAAPDDEQSAPADARIQRARPLPRPKRPDA